jgi:uncharacterized RDD family membrane protein YckC
MVNQFAEVMSKRTDEELIKITTIDKDGYELLAVEAAEDEIRNRGLDTSKIEELKTEITAKLEEQKTLDESKVSLFTRFLNFIIDVIAFFLIAVVLSYFIGLFYSPKDEVAIELAGYGTILISFLSYYIMMELTYQKTLGKFITKTKVETEDGNIPELGDIVKRTFCRLIPFDRVSFLFTKNGIHDSLSKTRVVKDRE